MTEQTKSASANLRDAIEHLRTIIPADRVLMNEPMARHTSFRIGGPADAFVIVNDEKELAAVLGTCTDAHAEHMLVGNGSNFLVSDDGFRGIMIRLGGDFEKIYQNDDDPLKVTAGAARSLSSTSVFLTERGLAGMEFASGIPGSIGGAIYMNAGAYGGEMKDVVTSVRVMTADGSEIKNLPAEEMDFGYRHSIIGSAGLIVLGVTLRLTPDEPEAIAARVSELQAKRNARQPVNYPSAGSTFKRPAGGFAAALIDQAGLKGYRAGGAMVSEKHAGFVINAGGATCEDVLAVMRHVRDKVQENSGIVLEPEVRLIGCEL